MCARFLCVGTRSRLGRPPIAMLLSVVAMQATASAAKIKSVAVDARPATELGHDSAEAGLKWFLHQWKAKDKLSKGGDGLGPMFNATSCAGCHNQGGIGGGGPASVNVQMLSVQTDGSDASVKKAIALHPSLKDQPVVVLHRASTDRSYAAWRKQRIDLVPEANRILPSLKTELTALEIGLQRQAAALGVIEAGTANQPANRGGKFSRRAASFQPRLSERNTPALYGDGLIEQIPDDTIRVQMLPKQKNAVDLLNADAPNIEQAPGKASILPDGRVGKFGWKAQHATLAEFTIAACAVEVGLHVPSKSQVTNPRRSDETPIGYDMDQGDCDDLIAFVSLLPAPRQEKHELLKDSTVAHGELLFGKIGCLNCHVRKLGNVDGLYSDLLLHPMDEAAGDTGHYGMSSGQFAANRRRVPAEPASASEWRTPPLWGVADSAPYMHDGRAATLAEAIAAHGGQGRGSATRFANLDEQEQDSLLWFLKTLRAPTTEQLSTALASAK